MSRPKLKPVAIKNMVHKLEPYLKSGLSIRKACSISQIPRSTFNKYYAENEWFMYQIESFRVYQSVTVCGLIAWRLEHIINRVHAVRHFESMNDSLSYLKLKKNMRDFEPSEKDWKFIQWLATHSTSLREEYGSQRESINKKKSSSEDNYLSNESSRDRVNQINTQISLMKGN